MRILGLIYMERKFEMDSNGTECSMASRPLRRAFYWGSTIVLCTLLALFYLFLACNHTPAGKPPVPTTHDPCQPHIASPNDKPPAVASTTAQPGPNQPSDTQLAHLVDTATADAAKQAKQIIPDKISKPRSRLLKTLSKETTLQSIENLPNFDDTQKRNFIQHTYISDSYDFLFIFIPRLARVRKILEDTPNSPNPHEVTSELMMKLQYSTHGYAEVLLAFQEAMLKNRESVRTSTPHDWQRRQVYSAAAVYLLSELRAYDALPLMSKVYHSEEKLPLSRLFVFYAMHLLAVDHPRTDLSPQAQKALDAYLQASADLPKPVIQSMATSKAAYDETDVRVSIMRQNLLKNQPKLQMRIYPAELRTYEKASWGTPQVDPHWLAVDPKIDNLANLLKTFIDAAYPQNHTSADKPG